MLKNTPKVYYLFGGKARALSSLLTGFRKDLRALLLDQVLLTSISLGNLSIPASSLSEVKKTNGWHFFQPICLFLKTRSSPSIGNAGMDAFFKMVKSFLKLAREFQVRTYDALVSHISIVFIRSIMLAVVVRRNTDTRTFSELFYACYDEIQDMTLINVGVTP